MFAQEVEEEIVFEDNSKPSASDPPNTNDTTISSQSHSHHHGKEVPLVELSLENVTYAPVAATAAGKSSEKARKTVLHSVTTKVQPYTLTAWMGPSGSGKTSLLSVAADFIQSTDLMEGSLITVNGEEGRIPKRLVGVVWQDDLLLSNLTVQENVWYTARLKTPQGVPDETVTEIVHETIRDLGLWHVKDSVVGNPLGPTGLMNSRGISGGERYVALHYFSEEKKTCIFTCLVFRLFFSNFSCSNTLYSYHYDAVSASQLPTNWSYDRVCCYSMNQRRDWIQQHRWH